MNKRRGYTLLEVLLVLAITTVLVAAIGSAINIYLRSVEAGRAEVEQAQLARALLRRIADDLRSAVPKAPDAEGVESSTDALTSAASSALAGSGSGSSGSSSSRTSGGSGSSGSSSSANVQNITGSTGVTNITGSTGTTEAGSASGTSSGSGGSGSSSGGSSSGSRGSSGGSGSMSQSSGSSGMSSSGGSNSGGTSSSGGGSSSGSAGSSTGAASSESESTGEATAAPLGVYGTQYDLQVDVSRVPRTDRMDSLTGTIVAGTGAAAFDPPSDVKTVTYYIAQNAAVAQVAALPGAATSAVVPSGGLVRREVDRSVVNYGTLYGGSTELGTTEQLLAPEATSLEFRYFDGTEWLTDWSSSDRSAVPVAVEILLTLRAPEEAAVGSTWLVASPALPQEQTYRLLVHLPAGVPSSAGDAEAATESTTETTTTTGASP
ncbi:MAG: prepilin-type N-terminal cleavage/methylation domain-containing protein [Pirellulales bacterium]